MKEKWEEAYDLLTYCIAEMLAGGHRAPSDPIKACVQGWLESKNIPSILKRIKE